MFGISFLSPAFLAGAAAVAVPIVLHLLKREAAPRLGFSAVRFLKRAPVEQMRRKRLRELLLLALRVTALLLLALSFARPYVGRASGAAAPVTVVAVDTSFSMGAPGQFDRARELARRAIDAAPRGALVAVVAFSDAADAVIEPAPDRRTAAAALDRLAPGYGATRYRAALAKAAEVIGARSGRIVVVTDLQRTGWEADDQGGVPERVQVDVADVGPPPANLAVTAIAREPAQTIASVFNGGSAAAPVRATLWVDDRRVAETRAVAEPGVATDVRFATTLPTAGVARVTIDDGRGAPADNARFLVLDPRQPVPLIAVTTTGDAARDALYLDRALAATPESRRFALRAVSGDALSALAPETLRDQAAVLLLATRNLDRRARETVAAYVRDGGGLLIVAGPDIEPAAITSILGEQTPIALVEAADRGAPVSFAPADARHPIFRPFGALVGNLGQVRFRRTMRLEIGAAARVVGQFSDSTPALVEYRPARGQVLVFASDLDNRWNDFPLHPTFVPFVHEAVRYVARERNEPREFVVGNVPAEVPREPGVATVGRPPRRVAVNVDARESDAARIAAAEFQTLIGRLQQAGALEARSDAREREARQSYWRYGLLLMVLALIGEALLGSRVA